MLANILECCRTKEAEGIQFSQKTQEEVFEIFQLTSTMLRKIRDTLVVFNKSLLGQIKSDGKKLDGLVESARCANWERLEAHICSPQEATVYVEILDCFKNLNGYVAKMSDAFLDLIVIQDQC
jgi:Na+/phosphate symporter